jgi:hypothetical protein
VDLEEPAVDAVVVGDDDLRQLDVLVLERLGDPVHLLEDEIDAADDAGLEVAELLLVLDPMRPGDLRHSLLHSPVRATRTCP